MSSSSEDPRQQDPGDEPELEPDTIYRLAWGFYLVLAIAAVLWLAIANETLDLTLFVDRENLPLDLGLGVASALVLVGGWRLGRAVVPAMRELEGAFVDILGGLDGGQAFALALLSGFAEEIFFRGAVQGSFGWIWATLIFGLLHTGPGRAFRLWTVFALVAGLAFAGLTLLRGNLLPAIVGHFLVNWIQFRAILVEPPASVDP